MDINEKVLELKVEEQKLQEELSDWKSKIPSGNMGKWHKQAKVDSITDKLAEIQKQIHFHDSIYLSSEIYKQWNTL
jgi:peptidoglycan hydrolase CwlO-like protein